MKEYTVKILIAVFILVLFVGAGIGLYYVENYETSYYTKVDNSEVTELLEDKQYEYSLISYNKKGKKRKLKFKTSRKLRDDAYLKLTVRSIGVHKWEEVQKEDVPFKASKKMDG